jgi:putative RecB family exonuclease
MYRYRTIDRLPEEPSAAAIRGSLIHRVLDRLFSDEAPRRTLDRAEDLVQHELAALQDSDPVASDVLNEAGVTAPGLQVFIRGYFSLEDPTRVEPQHREVGVAAELVAGFTIQGFIDRVDRSPEGLIRIVDYKTGKAPGAGFEAKAMFQMRFYALAWWRLTGDLPTLLQLMYLGSRDILRYSPTVEDVIATERKILAVRDAIEQAAVAGSFRASPSASCRWCSFQGNCPEFGNEPLDLPDPSTWTSSSLSTDHIATMLAGPSAEFREMPHA